jgi:hypothetical protein
MEKNPFENLGKNIRNTIVAAATVGGMAAGQSAEAQSPSQPDHSKEQTMKVTEKTQWAKEALSKATSESKYLQSAADVAEFERVSLQPFIHRIGMLSEGAETKAGYSIDEYRFLLKELEAMGKLFEALEKKYGISRSQFYIAIHQQLTYKSSYAGYQESKKAAHYFDGLSN